jgi:hypothetical protein
MSELNFQGEIIDIVQIRILSRFLCYINSESHDYFKKLLKIKT